MNSPALEKYRLSRNPFPPAATGIDIEENLWIPASWNAKVNKYFDELSSGNGVKAFPIIGDYGSGKTVLLQGYLKRFFESKRIKSFYFENPGVQFYDLANSLLRTLGRYEFSKALWELCKWHFKPKGQTTLFPLSFEEMLKQLSTKVERDEKLLQLSRIIKNDLAITDDEEISYRLASMIIETKNKPYFEYREFIAGQKGSLVAEKAEHKYFKAIIKSITTIYSVEGVAFLIDEFEDIAIPKRMPRNKSYEYLATLRHLIDISETENLWIAIAMTPEAAEASKAMNPPLWERFTHNDTSALSLDPLTGEESKKMINWWLDRARDPEESLFPFSEDIIGVLEQRPDIRLPRSIVKICFYAISRAVQDQEALPISGEYFRKIVGEIYPLREGQLHD
ncbi:MAG: hypothetical protein M0Q43_00735 [Methanothrix sp.]|jgi:hypothetical protein|nr:hypothetical protein [Methanothrix sp.]